MMNTHSCTRNTMRKTLPLSLLLLISVSLSFQSSSSHGTSQNSHGTTAAVVDNYNSDNNDNDDLITSLSPPPSSSTSIFSSHTMFADAIEVTGNSMSSPTSTRAIKSSPPLHTDGERNIDIQPSKSLPSSTSSSSTSNDKIIIVATVDGSFYGLSRSNGEIVWRSKSTKTTTSTNRPFDNNKNSRNKHSSITSRTNEDTIFAPLINTSTTRSSTINSISSWRTSAVPSIDGRVFLTLGGVTNNNHNSNNNGRNKSKDQSSSSSSSTSTSTTKNTRQDFYNYAIADTTITTSMKDIVDRSPFMDSRGRFYVSSKETYAIALDRDTGEIVKVVNGKKNSNHIDGNNKNSNTSNNNLDHDNTKNGDDNEIFDFHDIFDDDSDTFCNNDNQSCHQRNNNQEKERNLVWMGRIDYSVSVHDARTGELDVQFSTSEVLSVDDMIGSKHQIGNGKSNYKYFENNSKMLTLPTGESDESIALEEEQSMISTEIVTTPGGKVALCDPNSGKVIWIANDTFDTPVAFAVESSKGSSLGVHVVPDAPNAHQFSKEYVSSELAKDSTDNSFFTSGNDDGMSGTVFGALETGQLFALPLGGQKSNAGPFDGLPHIPRLSSTVGSSKHSMGKLPLLSGRGELLQQQQQWNEKDSYAVAIKKHMCDPNSENYPSCILESYIKSNDDWLFNNNLNLVMNPDQDFLFPQPNHNQGRSRSKTRFFLKLMTSWIPPAVALAFVVSFELGRREKIRVEAAKSKNFLTDDTATLQSDKSSSSQADGVIDVYDEVLGYGGHGTVVYKGKLEGRHVAVKRMLKAYHASADREISLLIESDGHPNVVRYFLKEIRGDFVYLALELCDMNLQDLINVLAKKRLQLVTTQNKGKRYKETWPVDDSTKQLLFEIASGVKHIHSLRIVHRDLKPANILLARKSRGCNGGDNEIYKAFQSQHFVVKISDMGLGKQLLGQSSFGMSTMNNSFRLSKDDASTVAGAGPGSVGWQAPEVMAYRLSPESPLLEESSNPGTVESSPINASLNGRTSRSVDIFSLGCIFFCTVLPGSHPFGEWYEREANIMKNSPSIDSLQGVATDAADLILSMLHRSPRSRPTASQVCNHPFFWSPMKRLSFLCDLSDRLEIADTDESNNDFDPYVIEKNAAIIVGTSWDSKLDAGFFNHVAKFRKYDPCSVRDCLRLIRNRNHHFDELPADLKERVCSNQEEMIKYFESIFPNLLMHCYNTCREHLFFTDNLNKKYEIPSKVENKTRKNCPKKSESWSINSVSQLEANVKFEPTKKNMSYGYCDSNNDNQYPAPSDVIVWEKSGAASTYNCRGWMRSEDEWMYRSTQIKKRDIFLSRCAVDGKFRTRLCNHWDESLGTYCPMRKKNKCDFAHGPIELRVKEGKRNRWGKLVDVNGNNSNPKHSGGEDTYGAARSIETARKEEGKWNSNGGSATKPKKKKKSKS